MTETTVKTREVTFKKQNGESRTMRYQRLSDFPKSHENYSSNPVVGNNERVYDVEAKAFRTIPTDPSRILVAERVID